eukprot:TRINITY_DN2499_c0_g1_i1.p1 TRINITY_DN2499_c0_g1~~TRINITY_DN2499_c0_g1_i1.p1  ORF type:complete len:379 (+),score=60.73 TRINITY_DN2499_c0_g1_i1:101-1138(+)
MEAVASTSAVSWPRPLCRNSVFADQAHALYYSSSVMAPRRRFSVFCGKNKAEKKKLKALQALRNGETLEKKSLKRLEALSKDLYTFLSFSSASGSQESLAENVRGQILSEALQKLSTQLEQAKAERKERKRQLKAEKKALKRENNLKRKDEEESSSSSESSDDEECEIVDKTALRCSGTDLTAHQRGNQNENRVISQSVPVNFSKDGKQETLTCLKEEQSDLNMIPAPETVTSLNSGRADLQEMAAEAKRKGKIQVCTGGKCRKLGGPELIGEFEKSIQRCGAEGDMEVVACRCLGKCRSAPNVRVERQQDDGLRSLHLGIGFDDVDLIVSRYLRETEDVEVLTA